MYQSGARASQNAQFNLIPPRFVPLSRDTIARASTRFLFDSRAT